MKRMQKGKFARISRFWANICKLPLNSNFCIKSVTIRHLLLPTFYENLENKGKRDGVQFVIVITKNCSLYCCHHHHIKYFRDKLLFSRNIFMWSWWKKEVTGEHITVNVKEGLFENCSFFLLLFIFVKLN